MHFEIYEVFESGTSNGIDWETESRGWNWRLVSRNGRIMASAFGYNSKRNVRRAIDRISAVMLKMQHRLPIVEVES